MSSARGVSAPTTCRTHSLMLPLVLAPEEPAADSCGEGTCRDSAPGHLTRLLRPRFAPGCPVCLWVCTEARVQGRAVSVAREKLEGSPVCGDSFSFCHDWSTPEPLYLADFSAMPACCFVLRWKAFPLLIPSRMWRAVCWSGQRRLRRCRGARRFLPRFL